MKLDMLSGRSGFARELRMPDNSGTILDVGIASLIGHCSRAMPEKCQASKWKHRGRGRSMIMFFLLLNISRVLVCGCVGEESAPVTSAEELRCRGRTLAEWTIRAKDKNPQARIK